MEMTMLRTILIYFLSFFYLTGHYVECSPSLKQNEDSPKANRDLEGNSSSSNSNKTSDCSQFRSNPLEIITSKQLILHLIIDPLNSVLTAELIWKGKSWIAFGIGPEGLTAEKMVGSNVVIGLPESQQQPFLYELASYDSSEFVEFDKGYVINASIVQDSAFTILNFTVPLEASNRNPISMKEPTLFVWAVGSSNEFGYHSQRGGFTLLPQTCTILTDGGIVDTPGSSSNQGGGGIIASNPAKDYRSLWVVHGTCAAIAWAILVPLAIGSSLLRQFIGNVCFPQNVGLWFEFHRALNMLAILLTIVAFSIAVYIIGQNPNARHFDTLPHHKVGLAVFLLCLIQASNGILRPHAPAAAGTKSISNEENPDESEIQEENHFTKKTTGRIVWEVAHRILGVTILAMAWWQIQDGLKLYSKRYTDSDKWLHVFWGVVGGLVGVILIVYTLQKMNLTKA
jgi:hypothetical protein